MLNTWCPDTLNHVSNGGHNEMRQCKAVWPITAMIMISMAIIGEASKVGTKKQRCRSVTNLDSGNTRQKTRTHRTIVYHFLIVSKKHLDSHVRMWIHICWKNTYSYLSITYMMCSIHPTGSRHFGLKMIGSFFEAKCPLMTHVKSPRFIWVHWSHSIHECPVGIQGGPAPTCRTNIHLGSHNWCYCVWT